MAPSASDLIKSFGGIEPLAALTGARPNAVRQWRRIGIPYRFWKALIAEAAARGISGITYESLEAMKPRAGAEAA